ncbi:MAG: oxidoreductase [Verrucomicrobia bacterium]|nr:oxidoreductase [Verrucomicrobiota bacterium]
MNAGNSPLFSLPAVRCLTRRRFVQLAGTAATGLLMTKPLRGFTADEYRVDLPPLQEEQTEGEEPKPSPGDPPAERIGFAVVGLGHLALEQVLPAFNACKHSRPVALVSGHAEKARRVAAQHGIPANQIYDYASFDRIRDNPAIQAIYIALPNSLHAEYTVRGAQAGKHILCEKPMAVSVPECQQMIDACRQAGVKLMIGYRSQYEPLDRLIVRAVREKKLGTLREFVSANSIHQGDPKQWRLNKRLAGGGPLPDVGIYSINAARFMSGEEPSAVFGHTVQWADDPRFKEVETSAQFVLQFPSGFTATCSCSYASHRSQFLRLNGSEGWAEMDPAFAYKGLHLRMSHLKDGHPAIVEPGVESRNQFALELDHFAQCVGSGADPHTPGEEGLQDMRIIEAIYDSARIGKTVQVETPAAAIRGPDLKVES